MTSTAYWVTPQGEFIDLGYRKHIESIVSDPWKFGITRKHIEDVYTRHNEKIGAEGKAREELIKEVVKYSRYLRIRLYPNKYWSITLYDFDDPQTKKLLTRWASLPAVKGQDEHMPIKILDTKTNKTIDRRISKTIDNYTVSQLSTEDHIYENYTVAQLAAGEYI